MSDDIARLLADLNSNPDAAHGDYTPAVHALVRIGLPALPPTLRLLQSEDRFTRMRAQRVLEGVTRRWLAERTPEQPLSRSADHAWRKLWQDNGSYDWQADGAMRAGSIAKWDEWLRNSILPPSQR